jgi:hypothetical protein
MTTGRPRNFVVSLLRTVFGKSEREASAFTSQIHTRGKCECGPYPVSVAKALLEEAWQRIGDAGHSMLITGEDAEGASDEDLTFACTYEALGATSTRRSATCCSQAAG